MGELEPDAITEEQVREANGKEPSPGEPDVPLEGPEHEPEPEPAPEPEGPTPEAMEERFKAVAKAHKVYTGKVSAIFEEQANELLPCPLCADTVPAFVHIGEAGHVGEETKKAVLTFMGVTQEADYRDDPNHKACPDCDGLGKVKTGSKVANYATLACARCKGSGFYPPPGVNTNGQVEAAPVLAAVGAEGEYVPPADADPWGSPRLLDSGLENPNYGRMPQFKDASLP